MSPASDIYRVLDANLNRLREALRVLEEYFRFIDGREETCVVLKELRHLLVGMEEMLGSHNLLTRRDTTTDCFAEGNRPEEMERKGIDSLLAANFRRGQEAARVIEEYAKTVPGPNAVPGPMVPGPVAVSDNAKKIRFTLYNLEKETRGSQS